MKRVLSRLLFITLTCLVGSLFLVSCKSKIKAVETAKSLMDAGTKKIIENHYNNTLDFSTMYIKSSVRYSDANQSQNVTAEIRIKKDEQILVSIRFLGITMAKASITPSSVSYYEKMGGTYFEGDFSLLSQKLGTDLDFNKIQNMLLGRAFDDLYQGEYSQSFENQVYKLEDTSVNNLKKSFYFDSNSYLLTKQEIEQITEARKIQVDYSDNIVYKEGTLPSKVLINALQGGGNTEIRFEYNTITFNEALSFPYSVPDGYNRIIIK